MEPHGLKSVVSSCLTGRTSCEGGMRDILRIILCRHRTLRRETLFGNW